MTNDAALELECAVGMWFSVWTECGNHAADLAYMRINRCEDFLRDQRDLHSGELIKELTCQYQVGSREPFRKSVGHGP